MTAQRSLVQLSPPKPSWDSRYNLIILQEVGVDVVLLFKLVERKKVPITIQNILDKDYLLV